MESLAAEPHARLRYFCSPQHTDSAFYPIISQMERAAGFAHDDTAQAKLDKLDALLVQSFTPRQDAALLAGMLSLPNDGTIDARTGTTATATEDIGGTARPNWECVGAIEAGSDDLRRCALGGPNEP